MFKDVLDDIVQHKKYLPAKNKLQEYWQDKYKTLPKYRLLAETGPQHNKVFTVGIYHDSKILSKGEGRSKKFAEEAAAKRAVAKLNL
ncbi:MAG: putative dsRNA-binding protein [Candidatus Paceibacterota bacterium]